MYSKNQNFAANPNFKAITAAAKIDLFNIDSNFSNN
jgi:hypothetical protein